MKPVTGGMLVVAALLTSPAIAGAATGAMPLDVVLVRYLLVAGLCWVLLTLASEWLWSEPARPTAAPDAAAADQAGTPADGADGS